MRTETVCFFNGENAGNKMPTAPENMPRRDKTLFLRTETARILNGKKAEKQKKRYFWYSDQCPFVFLTSKVPVFKEKRKNVYF